MPATFETTGWVLTLVHEDKNETYTIGYEDQESRDEGMRQIMLETLDRQHSGDDKLRRLIAKDPVEAIHEWEGETGEYLHKNDMSILKLSGTMEVMRESIEKKTD